MPEGGWPNWVLGNHDQPRIASRIGAARTRVAAMLLLTLRGTPTLYYGDEIGMENVPIPTEEAQDPWEKNEPGLGLGRDPERTPMQWDASPHAGFTNGRPWLPLAADFATRNVAVQMQQPTSLLNLYRDLIALRRAHPVLHAGTYRKITALGDVLVFLRESAAECVLVALNLAGNAQEDIPLPPGTQGQVLLSTEPGRAERVEGTFRCGPMRASSSPRRAGLEHAPISLHRNLIGSHSKAPCAGRHSRARPCGTSDSHRAPASARSGPWRRPGSDPRTTG